MKKRGIALLLALVLWVCGTVPVSALAAGKDPLVLRTKKDGSTEYLYAYDEAGNCVYEEFKNSYNQRRIYYTYNPANVLVEKFSYRGDNLVEAVFYDESGNLTAQYLYSNGKETAYWGTPEYDKFGRLTRYTLKGPYKNGGTRNADLEDYYDVERIRYEYNGDPESIFFGQYEQDGNTANGPEPIEWLILDTDGDQMLLLSKYALDSRVYHEKNADVSWKDSDLRNWLADTFEEEAFTEADRYHIRVTQNGQRAYDSVFLLSTEQVKKYFPGTEDRICTATKYAVKRNAYVNSKTKGSWWLLRDQGREDQSVVSVNSDGTIDYDGGKVTGKRGVVRPAMWVGISAMAGQENPCRVHTHQERVKKSSGKQTSSYASLLTYNSQGVLTYEQIQNNDSEGYQTSRNHSYDDSGNLEHCEIYTRYPGDGGFVSELYLYENTLDKAGRVTEQVEVEASTGDTISTTRFRYDNAGRMISRKSNYMEETWVYDSQGNLLRYSTNGKVSQSCTYVPLSQALWEYE